MYEGRLRSAPGRERQRIDRRRRARPARACAGCRSSTKAASQRSPEEADAIAGDRATLLDGGTLHRLGGRRARAHARQTSWSSPPTTPRCAASRSACPTGVRVGTVDKFQGQEAQLVFFSLATSSGAEIPRSLEFLLQPQPAERR